MMRHFSASKHGRYYSCSWLAFAVVILVALLPSLSVGFAAKKKGGKRAKTGGGTGSNVASNQKGFGVQPPSFEQVVSAFKTRLPTNAENEACPCGSGQMYAACCQPYHQGLKKPEVPLRVLQSRYSAFYYRIVPHIIATTHPTCQYWRDDKIKWAKELDSDGTFDAVEFVSLETGKETPGEDDKEAFVDFKVRIRTKDGKGDETIIREKSFFLRDGDGWLYAGGEARPEPVLKTQSS